MISANDFAEFLIRRAEAKDGYIMCAVGQDPKRLSEWYFSGQYSGARLDKANYWRENAERVFDCQGLADCYVSERTGKKVNVRARNNYATWCENCKGFGEIPPAYRVPGAAVFIYNGSYISHVGFLVKPVATGISGGDWWVVEARGVMYGVVMTRLSKRPWNRWGWMTKYFDYGGSISGFELGDRTLRYGCAGRDVMELQRALIALRYSCDMCGADGEFGKMTARAVNAFKAANGLNDDGVVGKAVFRKLDELLYDDGETEQAKETEQGQMVVISGEKTKVRTSPSATGYVLGIAYPGDRLCYGGASTDNGWICVSYLGETGFINAKFAKEAVV